VSSRGYAFGYLGGGLLLAGNLALIRDAASLGLSSDGAVQLALLSGGLWWGGFALVTFARLKSRAAARRSRMDASSSASSLANWSSCGKHCDDLLAPSGTFPRTWRRTTGQTVIVIASVFLARRSSFRVGCRRMKPSSQA